jgi:hypothetical protein
MNGFGKRKERVFLSQPRFLKTFVLNMGIWPGDLDRSEPEAALLTVPRTPPPKSHFLLNRTVERV